MGIKRYIADLDNTITNAFKENLETRATGSNMGKSDVVEVFSIYGQSTLATSSELARTLMRFPISEISSSRLDGDIPVSGNVDFYLRLFNAEHAETLPEDFTLVIAPVSRSWEEGFGLDMETYEDLTQDRVAGSNWLKSAKGISWTNVGGDYDTHTRSTASFTYGDEDLEVNITDLVEEWVTGSQQKQITAVTASADSNFSLHGKYFLMSSHAKDFYMVFSASDAHPTDELFTDPAPACRTQLLVAYTESSDAHTIAASASSAINVSASTYFTSVNASDAIVTITNDTKGEASAASDIDIGFTVATLQSGIGRENYGLGIFFTASQEAYFSSSAGICEDSSSVPDNRDGATTSFYTKKFFGRRSEFWFKRPCIEARWDSSKKDSRGNFFLSSALVPGTNNLNTLYLYNYSRGQLTDIADLGSSQNSSTKIKLRVFTGTGQAENSGTTLPIGGGVTVDGMSTVTGSWTATGIYSASLAYTGTETTIYDVWFKEGTSGSPANTQYHTGTAIAVYNHTASSWNVDPEYVTNITNLKPAYTRDERPVFRLYVRDKNWNPSIYVKATDNKESQNRLVDDAYYSIRRIYDDAMVVKYGTGSSNKDYTRLSHDVSGNYFDLDMSLLEKGHAYGIKFVYKIKGDYVEQAEEFKFRVE